MDFALVSVPKSFLSYGIVVTVRPWFLQCSRRRSYVRNNAEAFNLNHASLMSRIPGVTYHHHRIHLPLLVQLHR